MNDGGRKHLLSDKFTIGGEATAAAGPVGRDAGAQTDAMMNAEICRIPVRAGCSQASRWKARRFVGIRKPTKNPTAARQGIAKF